MDSAELMSTLTPQSIVKESIVKESKASSESEDEASSSDDDSLNILKIYSSNIEAPTKEVERKLNTWLTVFDAMIIQEAITRTQLSGKSFSYLNAILNDFKRKQVKTLDDIATYDTSFKLLKQGPNKHAAKQESLPIWTSSNYTTDDQPVDEATNEKLKSSLERIRKKK